MNQTLLKKIMGNISTLNVLLFGVLITFAANILPPLLNMNVSYTLPASKKAAEHKQEGPAAAAQTPSAIEYTVVAEQNLFHPDRKIPAEKKEEKPLPKPEFVLYGTLVSTDTSLAFMEDRKAPNATTGREKRQRTLRQGGTLSGYILSQIYEDRVVMTRGEDHIEVRVLNPTRAKAEAGAPTAAAGAPATPPQPAPGALSRSQRRTTRTAIPAQPGSGQ